MTMTPEELQELLLATFADQAAEQLQALNKNMLELENASEAERVTVIEESFRQAHSLKGAARSVEEDDIERISHHIESLLASVRDGQLEPSADVLDVILKGLDGIEDLLKVTIEGADVDVDVDGLVAALEQISSEPEPEPEPEPVAEEPEEALSPQDKARRRKAEREAKKNGAAQPQAEESVDVVAEEPEEALSPQDKARRRKAAKAAKADEQKPEVGQFDQAAAAAAKAAVKTEAAAKPDEPAKPKKAAVKQDSAAKPARKAEETVRISTAKLDALMAQVGELLAARIAAEQRLQDLQHLSDRVTVLQSAVLRARPHTLKLAEGDSEAQKAVEYIEQVFDTARELRVDVDDLRRRLDADSRRMSQVTNDLQDEVRRARMLPVSTVFDAFPRLIRDLSRELSKDVALLIDGGHTEVDRSVLEQLKSPLTHMLRNSVDHGLETTADRVADGKSVQGTIVLRAQQRGSELIIEIEDDGRGIDPAKLRAKAVENGLLSADQAAGLSEREALWLIFRSGFSTKQEVTDVSGRGVGMDVVREQMEQLHGRIDVESELGKGTRFTLTLPLSVATARCLLVRAADQTFALPINNIDRIVSVTGKDTQSAEGKNTIEVDGAPVLLAGLADVLGMTDPPQKKDSRPAIVVSGGEKKIAVAIDELLGAQEIALKKLPAPLIRVPYISGATIIGTGEVVCILTVNDIMRSVLGAGAATSLTARTAAAPTPSDLHATEGQKILVADDSVTIRTLQTSLLRSAGYIVDAACDGQEAWEMLNRDHYDIVVSDVEMPNMTGFDLTQKVRGDGKLKDKPIILVTTLASEEDQKRGIDAGADAYIIKGSKEQAKLLETVARLIS